MAVIFIIYLLIEVYATLLEAELKKDTFYRLFKEYEAKLKKVY